MNAEGKPKSTKVVFLDHGLTKILREMISGRTDSSLQAQFGISYNTWRKLNANMPIRASVAERLARRIQDPDRNKTE